jgi:Shwachman-Bodian-Diamond syndrome (SBDS) protein
MPRGNAAQTKITYKVDGETFVIFVDDAEAYGNWKKDKTIPLAQVVSGWKVFVTK